MKKNLGPCSVLAIAALIAITLSGCGSSLTSDAPKMVVTRITPAIKTTAIASTSIETRPPVSTISTVKTPALKAHKAAKPSDSNVAVGTNDPTDVPSETPRSNRVGVASTTNPAVRQRQNARPTDGGDDMSDDSPPDFPDGGPGGPPPDGWGPGGPGGGPGGPGGPGGGPGGPPPDGGD